MSIYLINKICYLAEHDPELREKLRRDPAAAIAGFELSEEERSAFLRGDVAKLHELGAHDYLLGHLRRYELLGLTREIYTRRMKTAQSK
ncbi:MAG: hypothetical protein HYV04_00345 [Deltaproteobacteria bacterium]|nr:hypothetical protein [Deltaproteobacteria bacterium]